MQKQTNSKLQIGLSSDEPLAVPGVVVFGSFEQTKSVSTTAGERSISLSRAS